MLDFKTAIRKSEIVILPLPITKNGTTLNAPFSKNSITLDDSFAKICSGKYVFCGMNENLLSTSSLWNSSMVFDYSKREEFAVMNAVPTSEGAIECAMHEYDGTINGSNCLVIGYGRIGKVLSDMLGGLGAGIAYTFVRIAGKKGVKSPVIVAFFSGFSSLVTLPLMIMDFEPMTAAQLMFLILAGLAATGGQFGITLAYTFAPAREISVYDYSQIIFATILGILFLGELPDKYSFVGYGIIISASLIMFILNNRKTTSA